MYADITLSTPLPDLLKAYSRLAHLPPPDWEFTQETHTLDSLLEAGRELQALAPELIPAVCQMVLRELGRYPEEERERLLRATLMLPPPEDETILRVVLERVPVALVLGWVLDTPDSDPKGTVRRLGSLFRSVPHRELPALLDAMAQLRSVQRLYVTQAASVLEQRLLKVMGPICRAATHKDAPAHMEKLALVGGTKITPLVCQLLDRTAPSDLETIETGLKLLGASRDRARAASIEPYLKHKNGSIRNAAVHALGELGGISAVELLDNHARQKLLDMQERTLTLSALARIPQKQAHEALSRFAHAGMFSLMPKGLRQHAARLLEELRC